MGYNVIVTESGDDFLEFVKNNSVSLIIMDINLKNTYLKGEKVNGILLSKIIKEDPKYSSIPILVVTAYSAAGDGIRMFEESKADDYLVKPIVEYKFLTDKINSMLNGDE